MTLGADMVRANQLIEVTSELCEGRTQQMLETLLMAYIVLATRHANVETVLTAAMAALEAVRGKLPKHCVPAK